MFCPNTRKHIETDNQLHPTGDFFNVFSVSALILPSEYTINLLTNTSDFTHMHLQPVCFETHFITILFLAF